MSKGSPASPASSAPNRASPAAISGLVHALGDKGVPDLIGPEGIELVALAGFLDRMAGEGRGIGEAPLVEGARRQSVGRGGVIRPPAGADRVPDDGIVHEWPRSASDRLPSHALS